MALLTNDQIYDMRQDIYQFFDPEYQRDSLYKIPEYESDFSALMFAVEELLKLGCCFMFLPQCIYVHHNKYNRQQFTFGDMIEFRHSLFRAVHWSATVNLQNSQISKTGWELLISEGRMQ